MFTNDNHVAPQIDTLVDPDTELSDVHLSPDLVWRAINNLKAKHSSGPDGYSSDFIKHLANSISLPLTLLFATSFTTVTMPAIWRTATVTPVFKKDISSDVNNYRPISLTCCCCKVMESIIKDQMLHYLLQNN